LATQQSVLDGIRVLDLTRLLPGPFCTMLLGDLGADVIKIEDPAGTDWLRHTPPMHGDTSVMFSAVNRNKRSVTLDLKTDEGKAGFFKLLASADVVVEGFRPGVMDRLGMGWDVIHERNSAAILCSISGFGQTGPYRTKAGHDLTYLALSGVLSLVGTTTGELAIPGVQLGDIGGGAQSAVIAILSALIARQRDGVGQWCDVSMVDGLVSWLSVHAAVALERGESPRAGDELLTGQHPCYAIYPCSDGYITVAAIEPQFWKALIAKLELPELEQDAFADGSRATEVKTLLAGKFGSKTRAEWAELFAGIDACVQPVLTVNEALSNPQIVAREMLIDGAGPIAQTGFPFKLSGNPLSVQRPAPGLGEHNADLLDA
jgi:crotonobetainyl-CoA:carnitine CoA-transferase CaiB-like acyl-CoA transferase